MSSPTLERTARPLPAVCASIFLIADLKTVGYPRLAEFFGSDERWLIFRRFSQLQARLLLEKQDEIRQIEEDLLEMDEKDRDEDPIVRGDNGERLRQGKLFTRYRRNQEEREKREAFFKKAETAYKEYAALVVAANQVSSLAMLQLSVCWTKR